MERSVAIPLHFSLFLQYFIYLRRVRLALGSLHHLPHEGIERFFLSRLELFHRFRIRSDDLVDQLFQFA